MTLIDSVQETIKRSESIFSAEQQKKMNKAQTIFEEMLAKGLTEHPTYNLKSISTLSADISKFKK